MHKVQTQRRCGSLNCRRKPKSGKWKVPLARYTDLHLEKVGVQ
ncbi:hypothetical protein NNO_0128 [Hydrogenimonas sp.]|nr:hypothetical protein NNO_0128 [Hydrogenimonas sp.]